VNAGAEIVRVFVGRFRRDDCLLNAAAMSFYGVLCLFPILLFASVMIGNLLGSNAQAREALETTLRNLMPEAPESIFQEIRKMAERPRLGTSGLVGLLTLVWSGSRFFDALDGVINRAWSSERRTYVRRQILALTGFGLAGLFCLLSLLMSGTVVTMRAAADVDLFGYKPSEFSLFWRLLGWLVPFAMSVLMFHLILWLMPVGRMPTRVALTCSLGSAALWELSKLGFARFVNRSPHYGVVYGSLAGTVLAMVWIYFSALILLAGVEAAGTFMELRARSVASERSPDLAELE
jgi:membrane protein